MIILHADDEQPGTIILIDTEDDAPIRGEDGEPIRRRTMQGAYNAACRVVERRKEQQAKEQRRRERLARRVEREEKQQP